MSDGDVQIRWNNALQHIAASTWAVLPLFVHLVHTVQQAIDLNLDHRQLPLNGKKLRQLHCRETETGEGGEDDQWYSTGPSTLILILELSAPWVYVYTWNDLVHKTSSVKERFVVGELTSHLSDPVEQRLTNISTTVWFYSCIQMSSSDPTTSRRVASGTLRAALKLAL